MKIYRKITASKADAICNTPEELSEFMLDVGYSDFNRLMSPLEVYVSMQGSCHDQVMFEWEELANQGLNPKAKFLIAVDDDGQGGETHSFVYYKKRNKWYWLENAWADYQGIHQYGSENALVNAVADAFSQRNPGATIYISDFNPRNHTIGEDLKTLVDKCMLLADEYTT